MTSPTRYSPEVRERAVRLVLDHQGEHDAQWSASTSVSSKLGCTAQTLRKWVRQAERERGDRAGLSSEERRRLKELERENRELRRAKRDPAQGIGVFCPGGARPPREMMVSFIDAHRGRYGGRADLCASADRPIDVLRAQGARGGAGARPVAGASRTGGCAGRICRVYDKHFGVYGVRKVWRQLRREGVTVARCTVARLMRRLGLQGAVRGRRAKTTHSVVHSERPDDRVNRGVQGQPPECAVGVGLDLRGHVAGVRLHGLRHRRLCAAYRGLAGVAFTAHELGPRCPRTGPS